MTGLPNSNHLPCSPETNWALTRILREKRQNGAELGSFSPLWPLEVVGLISYFLEVEMKTVLVAQAPEAVLGASNNRNRARLVCRSGNLLNSYKH